MISFLFVVVVESGFWDRRSRGCLQNHTVFTNDDLKERVQVMIKDKTFSSPAEDSAIGSLLGMAIGDAMGHVLEFQVCYCIFLFVSHSFNVLFDSLSTTIGSTARTRLLTWVQKAFFVALST